MHLKKLCLVEIRTFRKNMLYAYCVDIEMYLKMCFAWLNKSLISVLFIQAFPCSCVYS